MASRTLSEPSSGFEQLANRDSQRVAEAVQNVEGRIVVTLGVRNLPDRLPTKAGEVCEFPVRQPVTRPSFVNVYTASQAYRVAGPSFLPSLGYWGYPGLSSLGAAPTFRGRVLGTTSAGSCPPGCHSRQSCEPLSGRVLLLVRCGGTWGIRVGARAFPPICVSFPGSATGCRASTGAAVQRTALESTGPTGGSSWPACNRGAGSLSGPLGTSREA